MPPAPSVGQNRSLTAAAGMDPGQSQPYCVVGRHCDPVGPRRTDDGPAEAATISTSSTIAGRGRYSSCRKAFSGDSARLEISMVPDKCV